MAIYIYIYIYIYGHVPKLRVVRFLAFSSLMSPPIVGEFIEVCKPIPFPMEPIPPKTCFLHRFFRKTPKPIPVSMHFKCFVHYCVTHTCLNRYHFGDFLKTRFLHPCSKKAVNRYWFYVANWKTNHAIEVIIDIESCKPIPFHEETQRLQACCI